MAAVVPVRRPARQRGLEQERRHALAENLLPFLSEIEAFPDAKADDQTGHAFRAWIKHIRAYTDAAQRVLDAFRREEQRRKARAGEPKARTVLRYFTAQNPLLVRLKLNWDLFNVLCDVEALISDQSFLNFAMIDCPRNVQRSRKG